jgi:hypothetical protein
MTDLTAFVQAASQSRLPTGEPRSSARPRPREALVPAPESRDDIGWGAVVRNLCAGGLGLLLCYPFKPGTLLAISLQTSRLRRTLFAHVTNATERADGRWLLGCEFTSRLSEQELATLL